MRFRPLLTLGIFAIATGAAMAQPRTGADPLRPATPSRYVPFPFDVNAEVLVQDRLNQLKDVQHAQDFIKKLLDDPSQFKLDDKTLDKLKHLKLDDPRVRDSLKPWIDKTTGGKPPALPEELSQLKETIKQAAEAQKEPPSPAPDGPAAEPAGVNPPPEAAKPPDVDAEDDARDWLREAMERAQDSNLGEWLRNSPGFQKALQDLHASMHMPGGQQPHGWGLDRLFKFDKLPMPNAETLERLGRFRPQLPHINPPSLPSLNRPSLPPVSAPSTPSMSSLGTLAIWLLCLGLVALFGWQVSRWVSLPGRSARDAAADLGPWPVQPGAVSTRTELVRAFDHLAVLLFGVNARTWHHRAVAQAMAQHAAACAGAAVQLAALYEKARYTEAAELLGAEDRDRARSALRQLAGVAL